MAELNTVSFQRLQAVRDPRFVIIIQEVGQGSGTVLENKKNGRYYMVDGGTSGNAPVEIL